MQQEHRAQSTRVQQEYSAGPRCNATLSKEVQKQSALVHSTIMPGLYVASNTRQDSRTFAGMYESACRSNPPLVATPKADPADFCPAQLPCCCCCCCCCCCQLHVLQPTTCAALLLQPTVCAAIGCSEVHWSCIGHHVFHWAVLILQAESYVQCDSMEWRRG